MKFPKVLWEYNDFLEAKFGYLRRLKGSLIQGACDLEINTIYLNVKLRNCPIYHTVECLFHELMHYIIRHQNFHRVWDAISRRLTLAGII